MDKLSKSELLTQCEKLGIKKCKSKTKQQLICKDLKNNETNKTKQKHKYCQ